MTNLIFSCTEVSYECKSWDGYDRLCVPLIQKTGLKLNYCCIKVEEVFRHLFVPRLLFTGMKARVVVSEVVFKAIDIMNQEFWQRGTYPWKSPFVGNKHKSLTYSVRVWIRSKAFSPWTEEVSGELVLQSWKKQPNKTKNSVLSCTPLMIIPTDFEKKNANSFS